MRLKHCLAVFTLFCTAAATAQTVDLHFASNDAIRLHYAAPVKLETLLSDVEARAAKQQVQVDPIQTQLFQLGGAGPAAIAQQKQALLDNLAALHKTKPKLGADTVAEQIASTNVAKRVFIPLDYDVVQSQLHANPQLTGHFALYIGPRNLNVQIVGAVRKTANTEHTAQASLPYYLHRTGNPQLASASDSEAIVIQPDGALTTAHYANWNRNSYFLAPGATIVIPFAHLPHKFKHINEQIVALYQNQLPNRVNKRSTQQNEGVKQ